MKDPFPIAPIPALSRAVQPIADMLHLPTLPLHIHEVLGAALFYTFIHMVVSPWISMKFWPDRYPINSKGKRMSWDSHVVSMVQSCLINVLALYVHFYDEERWEFNWEQRVWGYTGACAMIQSLAAGYFVWDLIITALHFETFGIGVLMHAISALTVYSFGYRPVFNYYATNFILYELSTPFLNIHWFFDKLGMTGTKAQLINGICLISVFFSCRLIWGNWQSALVYRDIWRAMRTSEIPVNSTIICGDFDGTKVAINPSPIPIWLVFAYFASNLTLNMLNVFWLFKMISAVKKRFTPAKEDPAAIKEKPASASPKTGVTSGLQQTADALRKRNLPAEVLPVIDDDLGDMT
ncbi:transmembrane protein 56 [Pyricularia oryzae 70-15]|uniref:Transmembrane protein 56 n=3 Tax=Pyricularia oryzae TaxID=318829 RepID=G4MNJ3_PYRO7|nr:transmembrane protein 56, variant [Pyricularia oryzae 70-15]XP_003710512.1 transmembrane protein 56 [Pyricularia oryzae 70-15]ELQ36966.1 transmembrane protein 56 [Pyricularia oryzae Y34]KAI7923771.1 transmembrane protein 56 [Pyricularia oryzae]EHA57899.1 transmembrane protein 56, variant [Pyricularia oryzae 70-15]EHA57900.1 transmembrane protein 56 [Pyricularia oryzae 70-15]KAI7931288.1 transmembrane protein 56 [Pyricularia oryzae]